MLSEPRLAVSHFQEDEVDVIAGLLQQKGATKQDETATNSEHTNRYQTSTIPQQTKPYSPPPIPSNVHCARFYPLPHFFTVTALRANFISRKTFYPASPEEAGGHAFQRAYRVALDNPH